MTQHIIHAHFNRVLSKLENEIKAYSSDQALWQKHPNIGNPGGNLCLHLLGSLQFLVGTTLGNTGYVRSRDAEFTTTGLAKEELLSQFEAVRNMLESVMPTLTEERLQADFPAEFAGKNSTEFYLLLFIGHFEYHIGQINYHRRLLA